MPNLKFRYVDRDIDCLRREPGVKLTDGTWAKRAIVADFVLKDGQGFPIFSELKIRADKTPFVALIQTLAATAHLITGAQRDRLRTIYGLTPPASPPYADALAIFFEPDKNPKAKHMRLLGPALEIADAFKRDPRVAGMLRHVALVEAEDVGSLKFHRLT
jgi:hypothetical protein